MPLVLSVEMLGSRSASPAHPDLGRQMRRPQSEKFTRCDEGNGEIREACIGFRDADVASSNGGRANTDVRPEQWKRSVVACATTVRGNRKSQ